MLLFRYRSSWTAPLSGKYHMKDSSKTKAHLIAELEALRQRTAELEAREAQWQAEANRRAAEPALVNSVQEGLASRLAMQALENARLFAETHQRAAELAIINNISQALASQLEMNVVVDLVGEKLREVFKVQYIFIALYDRETELLSFPYFVDEYDPEVPAPLRPLRNGLTEYVLRTGEPLLATPEVHEALVARGEAELIGAPSLDWLGVPLRVKDRTIGVVVAQTYEQGVRYGQSELDILTFVSAQTAMAIERRRAEAANRRAVVRQLLGFRLVELGPPTGDQPVVPGPRLTRRLVHVHDHRWYSPSGC